MSALDVREPIDLDFVRIDPRLAARVPESLALRRGMILFGGDENGLYAACLDPSDDAGLEALERAAGQRVHALRAEPESLRRALSRLFRPREDARGDDAVTLLADLLHHAVLEQASDVHVEPAADGAAIRMRVDGVLELERTIRGEQVSGLLNRIKVLAGLDIAEKRMPQDGSFTHVYGPAGAERRVDVRVAVLPVRHGERATLRLLALRTEELTLEQLGMGEAEFAQFGREIRKPHGLVLLTGPTGSGKSTTLYAALRALDVRSRNVLTIEDPVEYDVPGVSQTEVDSGDRVTFARALRSALRHDPDVLMIGEIRDLETADVAVKAALTGHLVLSTLHTNSAASAVTRLVDMGVAPYLVAATLRLSVAQRLVRRLCTRCRTERPLTAVESRALGGALEPGARSFAPAGCVFCRRSGFAGRIGLFESFRPDDDIAARIAARAPEAELAHLAESHGMSPLRVDAARKVASGITTVEDVMKAADLA